MLKVVKSSAAKVEPLPLVGEGSDNYAGDEMVTKVVPVRNVSVRELAPILRQMIDSAGSGNVVNYDPELSKLGLTSTRWLKGRGMTRKTGI